ncbi:MAG: DUF624 domain-containing protein [Ruminococcus sp.]|nr:DUF624 domain-containing protein [Ruminococcus sp.]
MGLFKGYENSGPGISKYAPKKKGIALFFDIFFRKIWQITGLNMLFFIFLLPPYVSFFLFSFMKNYKLLLGLLIALFAVFAVLIGPAMAGLTKVTRLLVIQKHTYIFRDFFRGFRENFKKAVVVGIFDVIAALSIFSGYNLYPDWAEFYDNKLFYIPLFLTMTVGLVVFLMNYYIFLMMTATDLSLKNLFKNSFALAFAALKQNLISTIFVVFFATLMIVFFLAMPPFALLVIPFFPMALTWFIVCFNCYPVIQKYVINPFYESRGEINPELTDGTENIDEETIFEDMGGKEKPIEKRKKGKGKRIS